MRRASIVLLMRWAISVNTRTGQHTLIRRYESREFRGDLDGLYQSRKSEYLSYVALQQTAVPPSAHELTSATEQVGRSREELNAALMDLKRQIRIAGFSFHRSVRDVVQFGSDISVQSTGYRGRAFPVL